MIGEITQKRKFLPTVTEETFEIMCKEHDFQINGYREYAGSTDYFINKKGVDLVFRVINVPPNNKKHGEECYADLVKNFKREVLFGAMKMYFCDEKIN